MKFEIGHFYTHEAGRQVAVLGEVESYRWGKMLVVEEADKTGHSISCMEINEMADMEQIGWIEIGKAEWMRNFDDNVTCPDCGKVIEAGQKYVLSNGGPIHLECYTQRIKERGPELIETIH